MNKPLPLAFRLRSVRGFAPAALLLALSACGGGGKDWSSSKGYVTVGGSVAGLSGSLVLRNNGVDDLAVAVVRGVVERAGVDPGTVEDVVLGATQQRGELGGNVARAVAIMAGLPFTTAGTTVNRLC
ncbi:MAG: hypothetical protein EBS39_12350, partial [Gammaproteobacteria bacterium]|nr:hypothetical protein [Gammaproteobacteria bacterium]